MLNNFFNFQTKSITKAAGFLGIAAFISGLLGLFRDRLLAGHFGAGYELDVYFTAFRIPDFIYGVLIIGGITAAFLPIFSKHFLRQEKQSWDLTNNVLNCFLLLLVLICLVSAIFTPFLIEIITPGFSEAHRELVVSLTRIMLLSPILFGMSSLFSGVLQYFNRFLVISLAPILYNLGIIFGILFLVPIFGIWGLAYGVILGAFLHLLIQIPSAYLLGFRWRPLFNFQHSGLKKIFKLMIPRFFGIMAFHLNLIIITAIASTLAMGSIAIFNFANNLQGFAVGLVGISMARAAFPFLSKTWANNQKQEFLRKFSLVFRQILFLVVPISFLMFLLRAQIVRIILGTGEFGWWETRLTAASLGIFCLAIFAVALIPLITRAFFSLEDTKTPSIIAIFSSGVNIALCFLFVFLLGFPNFFQEFMINILKLQGLGNIAVVGLALALSLSGLLYFFLLLIFLYKKIGDYKLKEIFNSAKKIFLASIIMIIFAYFGRQIIVDFVDMGTFLGVFIQTILTIIIGIGIYILSVSFLKSPEIKDIKDWILKRQYVNSK